MNSSRITVGPRNMQEMAAFEKEIDAVRDAARQKVGSEDAAYIRRIMWLVPVDSRSACLPTNPST